MNTPLDILVTGFGPFPGVRVNPTAVLAGLVARRLKARGWRAEALVLETSYGGGLPMLRNALEARRPRAVLMLGIAARTPHVRVELFGRGSASPLHPDATGAVPGAARAAGPLKGSAPRPALAILRAAGIRARLSASAGRYLCDASYAACLRQGGPSVPTLFIHVPRLRDAPRPTGRPGPQRPTPSGLAAALAEIGVELCRRGRA